ncbi:hypothetical protein COC43_23120 [Bacillus thuringiensis]|uniref:MFS transporter n=1 Tax=Bacillus thuringiensis TaxID=1428 RepID=UPI000BFB3565|nr:MFS transporter [Bacillus thuringiensis]PGR73102.1 hypothetical protein COC43_23120 [Bacillus thuringiensis]
MHNLNQKKEIKVIPKLLIVFTAFHALWISQVISLLGDQIHSIGMIWYINNNLGGLEGEMLYGFAMSLPMAIVSIFAGVIVDRFKRTSILFFTDITRAVIVGIMAMIFIFISPNLLVISFLSIILGVSGLLFKPAVQSLLPDLAGGDRDKLLKMDSWHLGTITIFSVLGPSLAGFITPYVNIETLLLIDSLTFIISALFLKVMMNKLKKEGNYKNPSLPKKGKIFSQAREGLSYIFTHKVIGPQFAIFPLFEAIMFAVPYLLPILISEHFQGNIKLYGIFLGLWALGRILGMSLVRKTTLIHHRGLIFSLNFIVQGTALIMVTFATNEYIAFVGFLMLGIPAGAATISLSSFIQTDMPNEMRGRIFAAMTSMVMCLTPLGPIGLGFLTKQTNIQFTFLTISILLIILGLIISSFKSIRSAK